MTGFSNPVLVYPNDNAQKCSAVLQLETIDSGYLVVVTKEGSD